MTLSNKKLGMWKCPKCKANYVSKQVSLIENSKEYVECLSCHNCFDLNGKDITQEVRNAEKI